MQFSTFFVAAAAACFAQLASATLLIIEPTTAGWVGNTTVTIAWDWDVSDPNFTIELGNPDIQFGLLASGPIAIANNVVPNTGSLSLQLPSVPAGFNYFVAFVSVSDINKVYDQSARFSIIENLSSANVPQNTGTMFRTSANTSPILTGKVSTSTTAASSSSTASVTSMASLTGSSASIASSSASALSVSSTSTLALSSTSSSAPTTSTTQSNAAASAASLGLNHLFTVFGVATLVMGAAGASLPA